MHFNWVDYGIIGIISLSIVIALLRGFVREALSLVFWVLSFWVGFTFADELAPLLAPYLHSPGIRVVAGFLILFVLTLFAGSFVSFLLAKLIEKTGLSGTDRLLGAVFGIGRGALLVAVLLMLGNLLTLSDNVAWHQSLLIPHFKPLVAWLEGFLPSDFLHPNT